VAAEVVAVAAGRAVVAVVVMAGPGTRESPRIHTDALRHKGRDLRRGLSYELTTFVRNYFLRAFLRMPASQSVVAITATSFAACP
jgi:hypothetical protein